MFPRLKPAIIAIALIGFVSPSAPGIVEVYRNSIAQERRVERGSRIVVRNEFGDISIVGSDRDTIEAFATNLNGLPPLSVSISEALSDNKRVFTVSPVESGSDAKPQIKLVVKVPRYVELEPIYIRRGNITVSDLDGGMSLRTDEGNISARRVGSPGGGLVDVKMGSGSVDLSNINGDVRIVAISSNITVKCIKGDVAGRVMSGQIAVSNIDGDVELNGSSGTLSFTGPIRSAGHYRLNILSGEVFMSIPDKVGFTAVLSAYSGHLETDFQFSNASPTSPSRTNKRVIGKYGDGTGRIELDSFSGSVHLRKIDEGSVTDCKR
jgi:DUF4097 and DUF4098 domain-containing protein YvlB